MKAEINDAMKFFVLAFVMFIGFFTLYAFVWVGLGIPTGLWASIIVIALAAASVYGYVKWLEA